MFVKVTTEQAKYICQKMDEVGDHFALDSIENRSVMYLSSHYYLEHTVEECVAEIRRRIAAGEVTPDMVDLPSEGYVRPYIDPDEDMIIQTALHDAMADNMIVRLMGEDVDVSDLYDENESGHTEEGLALQNEGRKVFMFSELTPEQEELIIEKRRRVLDHFVIGSLENCSLYLLSPQFYLERSVEECVEEINRRIFEGEVTPDMFGFPSEGYVRPYISPERQKEIDRNFRLASCQNIYLDLKAEGVDVSGMFENN